MPPISNLSFVTIKTKQSIMDNTQTDDDLPIEQVNNSINLQDSVSEDSQEKDENIPQVDEEQKEKLLKLPFGRVKNIIKMDPDVNLVNKNATFLITKATVIIN